MTTYLSKNIENYIFIILIIHHYNISEYGIHNFFIIKDNQINFMNLIILK